jgi:hypothetical protein
VNALEWAAWIQRGVVLFRALRGETERATEDHARELERADRVKQAVHAAEQWAKGQQR